MDDIRKYINIITEAKLPGRFTYKPTDLEQEPEDSADIADLAKQAYNVTDTSPSGDELIHRKDIKRVIMRELQKFPKVEALMFLWHYAEGIPLEQIAYEKLNDEYTREQVRAVVGKILRDLYQNPEVRKLI